MPPVTVGTHEGEVNRILHLPTVTPAYLNTIDIPVLAAAFRGIREEMDPEETHSFGDMEPVIDGSVAVVSARFSVLLLGGLASLAAFPVLFGIYGVLAYLVQLNARSTGIQMVRGGPPSCFLWRRWWPAGYPDARPPGWIRWRFSRGTDGRPQGSPVVGIVAAPLFYPYSVPWN